MANTKTADPVATAQAALDQAHTTQQQAQAALDGFRDRILAGDLDVSSDDYAAAAHNLEHAQLRAQAAALALQSAQAAARRNRLAALADDITRNAGDPDKAHKAFELIAEGVALLVADEDKRRRNMTRWIRGLRLEGVPELDPLGKTRTDATGHTVTPYKQPSEEHGNLAWRNARMGAGDSVHLGDRTITIVAAGDVIAAAIETGCKQAGNRNTHGLEPFLTVHTTAALVNDPQQWLHRNY